jgi:hypothetical protein
VETLLAYLLAAAFSATPALAQPTARDQAFKDAEVRARATERCKANRGVDCETAEGLREWEMQERTRAQAIREGSRPRRTNG